MPRRLGLLPPAAQTHHGAQPRKLVPLGLPIGRIVWNVRPLLAKHDLLHPNGEAKATEIRNLIRLNKTTMGEILRDSQDGYEAPISRDTIARLCYLFSCQPGDLLTYIPLEAPAFIPEFDTLTLEEMLDDDEI